ncbi:alpha/beta-hydrolase [Xylariaceae sp. FL0662B]|nr:alpha/beta-hydrolase [Xylariaceae sp. FL0662B]
MLSLRRTSLLLSRLFTAFAFASPLTGQLQNNTHDGISLDFFASLERLSRLVDITYCVGTTGITQPFSCVSRCKDFPTLELITTWNTGALMSDSCGYIAVDHGARPSSQLDEDVDGDQGLDKDKKSQRAIIVAFRGTYSITNTIVDLSTVPQEYVPYPAPDDGRPEPPKEPEHKCHNCTVHMGFLASWQIAREVVLKALKPLHEAYPDYPIYLIGHSLGGAVAALAALELKVIFGWDNLIVTTFGEPRVGNDGFVKYLDAVFELSEATTPVEEWTYRRMTHVDDPVPLLPLSEWGYMSHAGEIFISKHDLPPEPSDIFPCVGDYDPRCIAGSTGEHLEMAVQAITEERADSIMAARGKELWDIPSRFKLWQLFFAHRDYFWRLGLCVPGGDPIDWDRNRYPNFTPSDEL